MRAIAYTEFGDPSVLTLVEREMPEPAAGQVRIKVGAAGLNPIDYKTRRGAGFVARQIMDSLPWVPGYDVAGVVDAITDPDGRWQVGDRVVGMIGFPLQGGGYAEYCLADENDLCAIPDELDMTHAAAIPLAGLTAWQALFEVGGLREGDKILIHAGAGGVGHFAVQFAKAHGAYVIATASREKHDFLHEIGADETIDYVENSFIECCYGLDFVLDTIGGETGIRSLEVLAPQGVLVTVPTVTADEIIRAAKEAGIRAQGLTVRPDRLQLDEILEWVDTHDVKVDVTGQYALTDAAVAHQHLEEGHVRGKLVLVMDPSMR
ncbi:MAG: NADP-dependent oxidoreductase [Hahellaceae bacterium]|nr:NADP-dependent oxidoreductase [Hahellaceae bacterium]